jgi:hypothetical protein
MSTIHVVPKEIIITKTIDSISISITNIIFGVSATFNVMLYEPAGQLIRCDKQTLSGVDYEAWGNNDQYVVNYMLKLYGLIQAV